jgi:hypothetical protein
MRFADVTLLGVARRFDGMASPIMSTFRSSVAAKGAGRAASRALLLPHNFPLGGIGATAALWASHCVRRSGCEAFHYAIANY